MTDFPRKYHAEMMWAGSGPVMADVAFDVHDGRIAKVVENAPVAPGAKRLRGVTIPGLVNAHSHVFHRALRGRTHAERSDFWSWRDQMYEVAGRLDPDSLYGLARATYAEMALGGITTVGEFHYLHHDASGRPYSDPNAMGRALIKAAGDAGIRITLIDTCYLRGGFDRPLEGVQRRFGDGDIGGWARRAEELSPDSSLARRGAAVHSVRALDEASIAAVAAWSSDRGVPLHFHLSEQRAENDACLEATGRTPAHLLEDAGALGPRSTAVHSTHVGPRDIQRLGSSGTGVCLCPTTERDLADGIGAGSALVGAGSPLALGSDSHAVIDLFEEMRAAELDERLATEERGHHLPGDLARAATVAGARSLGWEGGTLSRGAPADFATVTLRSVRTAGWDPGSVVDHLVFGAAACDVTDVVVDGRPVVVEGRHVTVEDVPGALDSGIGALMHAPLPTGSTRSS
jgi:formiminoglutamate deiminase